MSPLLSLLSWLYPRLLRLYPPAYRSEYGEELLEVYAQIIQESTDGGQVISRALRELRDFPGVLLRVHLRRSTPTMPNSLFPPTSDQTPWPTALLSLVPLFFIGPVSLILIYRPWPATPDYAWVVPLLNALQFVLIGAGVVVGVLRRFPRWSYPYPVVVVIYLTLFYGPRWLSSTSLGGNRALIALLLILLVFLVTRWLPPFRPFYTNLREDWTLLSYGLYACAIMMLSSQDRDEAPFLTFFVLLPSLISMAGALAHLRLSSAMHKILVLVVSIPLGTFLLWAPVFDGMMHTFAGFLVVLALSLSICTVLIALVMAPMLLGVLSPRTRTA
jgi:hypothetical protein